MPELETWRDFVATLKEMQPHPFDSFTPVAVPRPNCPRTIQVCGTTRYSHDGCNMFLQPKPPRPDDVEPFHRINTRSTPWILNVRNAPVQTPLGWSLVMERPLFWVLDNLVLPAHIAAYVLWRHRGTGAVWRTADPGDKDAKMPIGVWAGDDATAPALAYLMPFYARAYPRWSELRDDTPGP